MLPLVQVAFDLLNDPTAVVSTKNVACATILAALEHGLEVPAGAHMAVWRHVLASDGSAVVLHRHELLHEDVARDAVRVLLDADGGEDSRDLAIAVLKSENVSVITDEALVSIAERMMEEGKVRRLGWLIERLHEERGLSPEFLVALRERLAGSDNSAVRVGAVDVASLAARIDEEFAIRMINDPAPPVRTAIADLLEKADVLDKPMALVLVRERLDVEKHRTVLSSLHYAMASLVRRTGRRLRTWEPPSGGEN